MPLIKIERSNKKISDSPMRVKIFAAVYSVVFIATVIHFFFFELLVGDDYLTPAIMSAIAIGVMFLLLYEILKGMKSGRGIIAVSVFVVAIHLFGFVLGVALSFLLDFYLFYSPGMRRFFQ